MQNLPLEIDLICYDFDGVMTDNRVLVLENGTEGVFVNRGDGLAISEFRKLGLSQIILSTEENAVVSARGKKLKIPVFQGVKNKRTALEAYAKDNSYDLDKTVYVGNDINDLEVMKIVGCPVAPADAHHTILQLVSIVTKAPGGAGVIREIYDLFKMENVRE